MTTENQATDPNTLNADGTAADPSIKSPGSVDDLLADLNGEGEASPQEAELEDLMAAGWAAAKGGEKPNLGKREPTADNDSDDDERDPAQRTSGTQQTQQDPAASTGVGEDFRAQMEARFATLEKSAQSANGLAGHLKQELNALKAKGKPITSAALARVSAEFGQEFADAFAADLNEVGFGGGSAVTDEKVEELVQARTETLQKKFAKDLVLMKHEDAEEFFATDPAKPGKHNAAFVGWIRSLPAERQQEIGTAWEAPVVTRYLSEFKDTQQKAAKNAARQQSRVSRAVAPTGGAAAGVAQPMEDPLMQGWNNVKGQQKSQQRGSSRA